MKIVGSIEFSDNDDISLTAKQMNYFANNIQLSNGKVEVNKRFRNIIDFECNLVMAENILDYVVESEDFTQRNKMKRFVMEVR